MLLRVLDTQVCSSCIDALNHTLMHTYDLGIFSACVLYVDKKYT